MKHALLIIAVLIIALTFAQGCQKAGNDAPAKKEAAESDGKNNDLDDGDQNDSDDGDKEDERDIKVKPADLPQAVKDAVSAKYPGIAITKAELETDDGKTVYEVKIKKDGKDIEIEITSEGKILKEETEEADEGEDND